jgi:hypothetical protein
MTPLDQLLSYIQTNTENLRICSSEPAAFANVAAATLGTKAAPSIGAPANRTPKRPPDHRCRDHGRQRHGQRDGLALGSDRRQCVEDPRQRRSASAVNALTNVITPTVTAVLMTG